MVNKIEKCVSFIQSTSYQINAAATAPTSIPPSQFNGIENFSKTFKTFICPCEIIIVSGMHSEM